MRVRAVSSRREFLRQSTVATVFAAAESALSGCRVGKRVEPGDVTEASASDAIAAMVRGDLKAEDHARALLNRSARLQALNAFRVLTPSIVLEAARAADKRHASGETFRTVARLDECQPGIRCGPQSLRYQSRSWRKQRWFGCGRRRAHGAARHRGGHARVDSHSGCHVRHLRPAPGVRRYPDDGIADVFFDNLDPELARVVQTALGSGLAASPASPGTTGHQSARPSRGYRGR